MLHFLAAKKWIVYTINYRLSPKVTFPAHLIDCKRALAWIREVGAAKYGGDKSKIVVAGESAGGHLSTLMGLTQNQPEYQPGFEKVDTKVSGVIDLYGVKDFTDENGHFDALTVDSMQTYIQGLVMQKSMKEHPELFKKASPWHLLKNLKSSEIPPIMSIHGDRDSLVPIGESVSFHEALKKKREEAGESGKDVLVT